MWAKRTRREGGGKDQVESESARVFHEKPFVAFLSKVIDFLFDTIHSRREDEKAPSRLLKDVTQGKAQSFKCEQGGCFCYSTQHKGASSEYLVHPL